MCASIVDEPFDVAAIRFDGARRRALLERQKIVEALEVKSKNCAFVQGHPGTIRLAHGGWDNRQYDP